VSELRFDPIKQEYIIYSTKRQNRTFFPPEDYCPLCPTKAGNFETEVPSPDYDIVVFEDKFPSFDKNRTLSSSNPDQSFFCKKGAKGICEVVCYSSDHNKYLEDMPLFRISNLILVWRDRYIELKNKNFIKYVLIFENKGREIGVTLSHPHGQIYAFPFIPQR